MRKLILLRCWIEDQDYSVAACTGGGLGFNVLASGKKKKKKGDKKGRKQEKRKVQRVENCKTRKVCSRRSIFLSTHLICINEACSVWNIKSLFAFCWFCVVFFCFGFFDNSCTIIIVLSLCIDFIWNDFAVCVIKLLKGAETIGPNWVKKYCFQNSLLTWNYTFYTWYMHKYTGYSSQGTLVFKVNFQKSM